MERRYNGLIPAHAGKTSTVAFSDLLLRAHPRSRGENLKTSPFCYLALGSSPLTRGKPTFRRSSVGLHGLIPAHAGKTAIDHDLDDTCTAHPRSRGENVMPAIASKVARGSSPLTRGKPRHVHATPVEHGLIPAHAGKTMVRSLIPWRRWAHPRSRGENMISTKGTAKSEGSSPLTRGKRRRGPALRRQEGLIPAHAGKTNRTRPAPPGLRAHPRSRGENLTATSRKRLRGGSSPLTRGKPITVA